MFVFATSGQYLSFPLVSALSGNPVTGASGAISGRRVTDAGSMTVLSGNIVEVAGGLYRANLYDWDTSGAYIDYFFTASGCVPISISTVTTLAISGRLYPNLTSGQLYLASGTPTLPYSGQLSGQLVNANTIQVNGKTAYNMDGTLASGTANFVQFPTTDVAGNSIPADARYAYNVLQLVGGTGQGQTLLLTTYSGNRIYNVLSGSAPVAPDSTSQYVVLGTWQSQLALWVNSGPLPSTPAGYLQTVPQSGNVYLASGTGGTIQSGQVWLASGSPVLVYSGQLSGQPVTPTSGAYVNVPPATISGVNVTATVASGSFVTVPSSTLSGLNVNPASLLNADFSGMATPPRHSLLNASRKLINEWDTSTNSGYLTVFQEDGSTQAFTQAITSQSGAPPITALN